MTEIIVIAAVARNNVVGMKGDMPWSLRGDFLHFKKLTMGHPCIMGDVTYESLPEKWRPLPGRENIVLTFDKDYAPEGTTVFHDFERAIRYVRDKGERKAFVTGGASIYKLGIQVADTLVLTSIHRDYDGDATFPEVDFDQWQEVAREDAEGIDRICGETVRFSFLTYSRKR